MTFVPVMWAVWVLTVLMMAGTLLYRSRLGRDEEDQLFLDDSFSQEKLNQAAIAARVSRVQPVVKSTQVIAAVATLFVIGYYIIDIIHQFQ